MKFFKAFLVLLLAILLESSSLIFPLPAKASNFTLIKDTLQTSRLSFSGRVKSPTSTGSSHVWIYTAVSGNFTSISTAGLKPGDSVQIGATNSYTISSIIDDDEFTVTPVLAAGDAVDTNPIYFRSKPQQVITFTTPSAVAGGFFQVLLPSASSNMNDGIPDTAGFDFGGGTITLAATDVGSTYVFLNNVATYSGNTGCTAPANYHCFEFHYKGNGGIGSNIVLTIGNNNGTNTPIAPAAKASRVASQADTYTYYIKNFVNQTNPNSGLPTDDGAGSLAFIEGVRVTATVDPSITFKVEGLTTGTHCGVTTDVVTTSYTVPFGVMALDTFKTAAQKITVSTNAVSGYAVTAIENERMSNLAAVPSYIPDTPCDTTCPGAWSTNTRSGLGFTTAIVTGTPTLGVTSPNFREFNSLAATEAPFQIMSQTGIASGEAIDVCYKLAVGATQPAGDYENQITYTATATF